jgi:hypothetical protein
VQKPKIHATVDLATPTWQMMSRAFVNSLEHARSAIVLVERSQELYLDARHLRERDPGMKGEE